MMGKQWGMNDKQYLKQMNQWEIMEIDGKSWKSWKAKKPSIFLPCAGFFFCCWSVFLDCRT